MHFFFVFKQKPAYDVRISAWSSDVCSSDLGAEDHRPGGAERMAERDGAAVHMDLVMRDVQRLHEAQDDRGKGLVESPQVDVGRFHAGVLQRLFGGEARKSTRLNSSH